MAKPLRLVILGMMGRLPFGGHSWLFLNWLRGFSQLGHDVWYVEDDSAWPFDPQQNRKTDDCLYAVRHVAEGMERIGLKDHWAFRLVGREGACWGLSPAQLEALYRSCDLLINLEGGTELREDHLLAPFRLYLETDPVGAQVELANGTWNEFANHQVVATYGENFGAPDCRVPLSGVRYVKTRQPVDLELWPYAYDPTLPYFTTIAHYRQEGDDVEYQGETYYWSKHLEWEKFMDLPRRTPQPFELAMVVEHVADRKRLLRHGWRVIDPFQMSCDVFGAYPAFIRGSRGEFTVAKDQNIRLRSGWFSERDACYLASGKPVIAQDTGFSNILPTGEGLFAFSGMEEILTAIDAINGDYERQCRAARALAEEYFEATAVASRLLHDVGLTG